MANSKPPRYSTPEQRARFETLRRALNLTPSAFERRIPDPAAFELDVLRGNLRPFLQLLPTPPTVPKPRRRPCRRRDPSAS